MEEKTYAKFELLAKLAELDEYKKDIQHQTDPKSRKNKMKARLLAKLLKKEMDARYKPLWGQNVPTNK